MEGAPVSREPQEEQAWTVFIVRIVLDDLCAAHSVFNLASFDTAPEHSSRCVPGDFVMRRSEGTTDLLQVFSIIGHVLHHSREERHIKVTFLPGSSRVLSTRHQAPRGPLVPRVQALRQIIPPHLPLPNGGLTSIWQRLVRRDFFSRDPLNYDTVNNR